MLGAAVECPARDACAAAIPQCLPPIALLFIDLIAAWLPRPLFDHTEGTGLRADRKDLGLYGKSFTPPMQIAVTSGRAANARTHRKCAPAI